ncbi:hypothetical protein [Nocardia shimofusensis]|uniref:hypothetical protein n=1 Tax=Nocardia shimofusensis TaxID=228596 RepID=UPI00082B994F|nr:hypothetical protein [Nocardia shimofusensis]
MHGPAVGQPSERAATEAALGLLNLGVSESRTADRHLLEELARTNGYRLIDVLTIDDETYMPTAYIAERVRTAHATALLAPSFEHFGVSARVLPLVARLVVPGVAGLDRELDPPPRRDAKKARGRRYRMRSPILTAAALTAFLITAWALWPAPDPATPPTPAVIVLPDQTDHQ